MWYICIVSYMNLHDKKRGDKMKKYKVIITGFHFKQERYTYEYDEVETITYDALVNGRKVNVYIYFAEEHRYILHSEWGN